MVSFDFVTRASQIITRQSQPSWELSSLRGRLTEIVGSGGMTAAATVIREAQQQGEPVVWLTDGRALFFPEDLLASGIDAHAITIVIVPSLVGAAKAAVKILQSDAFGVVVFDGFANQHLPTAVHGKLTKLSQSADAATLFLTPAAKAAQGQTGSLISLRVQSTYEVRADNLYDGQLTVLKDKRNGNRWHHTGVYIGPPGLR